MISGINSLRGRGDVNVNVIPKILDCANLLMIMYFYPTFGSSLAL